MYFISNMDTRRLHNSDMKKLVRLLQNLPLPSSGSKEARQNLIESIRNLPRRLRSSPIAISSSNLCSVHSNLHAHLIDDIWAWLRYEIDGGIGKYVYPLIMSQALSSIQELRVRQLEPVRQMWHKDFELETSAPPGCEPIHTSHWKYQRDQCPACMLSRIGSDANVLYATFAGMVGRMTSKQSGTEDWQGPMTFDRIRSKRLRFVRYWIKATDGGDTAVQQAGELGVTLKHLAHAWKAEQRRLRFNRSTFVDMTRHDPKLGPTPRPDDVSPLSPAAPLGFNVDRTRFSGYSSVASSEQSQLDISSRLGSSNSFITVRPEDSISSAGGVGQFAAMTEALKHESVFQSKAKPHTHIRVDSAMSAKPKVLQRSSSAVYSQQASVLSMASSHTITSYDGGLNTFSRGIATDQPVTSTYEILTHQELLAKYRDKLTRNSDDHKAKQFYVSPLRIPFSTSVYSSYAENPFEEDPFEDTDRFSEDDLEASDKEVLDREVGETDDDNLEATLLQTLHTSEWKARCSPASTTWSGLY